MYARVTVQLVYMLSIGYRIPWYQRFWYQNVLKITTV